MHAAEVSGERTHPPTFAQSNEPNANGRFFFTTLPHFSLV